MFGRGLTSWQKRVVTPSSADSANSVHGSFSRVQKAKGMAADRHTDTQGVRGQLPAQVIRWGCDL